MKSSAIHWFAGVVAGLCLVPPTAAAEAGGSIDLLVDHRPGNPCAGIPSLARAIFEATAAPAHVVKRIHLLGGSEFRGEDAQIVIEGPRQVEIIADRDPDTCVEASDIAPAIFDGSGISRGRTVQVFGQGVENASIAFENLHFSGNHAAGALLVGDVQVRLDRISFIGNTATVYSASDGGGAIKIMGDMNWRTRVSLGQTVSFLDNHSQDQPGSASRLADGGAVLCTGPGAVLESEAIFASNSASHMGGAIAARSCIVRILAGEFRSNQSFGGGGALFIGGTTLGQVAEHKVSDALFANNVSVDPGAAIRVGDDVAQESGLHDIEIERSRFVENSGGGAVAFRNLRANGIQANIHLVDSRFHANTSTTGAGAIDIQTANGAESRLDIRAAGSSLDLPQNGYRSEFVGNRSSAADSAGAIALRGLGSVDASIANTAFVERTAFRDNTTTHDGSADTAYLSGDAYTLWREDLVDNANDAARRPAVVQRDGKSGFFGSQIELEDSTIRHVGTVLERDVAARARLLRTLVVGSTNVGGASLICSVAVEEADGLGLTATPRGDLRPGSDSVLRLHSPGLFQPCSDEDRSGDAWALAFDLDGVRRPPSAELTSNPRDIGAFEFETADDIFASGFDGAGQDVEHGDMWIYLSADLPAHTEQPHYPSEDR